MTDVINNVKNFIKKHWIIIWLVVIAALLAGSFSYAAYTNLGSVKRVVSTKGGAGTLFSSNNLKLVESNETNYSSKRIAISANGETSNFEIDICNYAQNDPTRYNDKDITYNLTLTLLNSDNSINVGTGYTINVLANNENKGQFTNGVCKIDDMTLTGGEKSIDKYKITVPNSFITDNVRIKAEAVPVEESLGATGNYKLAGILYFAENTATVSGWNGEFLEKDTKDYDGFNYIMKGQGKGRITLEWDSSKLEISKVFLEKNNLTRQESTTNNMSKITITVDSETKNRYDIQFYKTSAEGYDNIDILNDYVNFSYVETETT